MAQRLHIVLSEETTKRYLKLAREKTEGEINEDCEPSGASIQIDIWHLENAVSIEVGSDWIDIGEASVDLIDA
ncbi:hypothetical protein CWE08_07365 [Aliidiomarina iranensis]|uniref:Uncharacterized protein n=1 Tax=Aliidiomarina iranensis TaxID=1434071 RepID=A0A432VWE7_9GAMM|nr:hypothetical protein [Aliidiomarina iranensis]RUO20912.1 hypothetical protein CWE08_07365 [Aliidiomarina iranensis]